jgi:nucleotide-binding universal stress UspA family protein
MVWPTPGRDDEGMRSDRPLLLCYDGSEDAKHAIERAGGLLADRRALVVTVWEPTASLDSFAWSGVSAGVANFVELDRAAAEAEPVAIKAAGPVWKTIVETAERCDVAAIVMGSRGLTGVRSMLLGSVSNAVVHHTKRPTLVIHRANDDHAG